MCQPRLAAGRRKGRPVGRAQKKGQSRATIVRQERDAQPQETTHMYALRILPSRANGTAKLEIKTKTGRYNQQT